MADKQRLTDAFPMIVAAATQEVIKELAGQDNEVIREAVVDASNELYRFMEQLNILASIPETRAVLKEILTDILKDENGG